MSEYYVAIEVIYTDTVEANSEEEAIKKVINSCPYDNDPSAEPYVEMVED